MRTSSVYRGQSRTGIGEGPGHPVAHGEQYLAADPPLAGDGEFLTAARPWMTLDWRPTDEQVLGETIEAWSCFPHSDLRLVVRLSAAGVYDRRTAYFAHGRAFPASELKGACDPGAWLGRTEAFEEPWRDGQRPAPPRPPEPEMVRPAQVFEEPAVAGALLAHLYQGLVLGYPVVLAAPVADFAAGAPIHALVSFARAALPLSLKADCRIRVFTRLPELFLRQLRADLVVIPENEAGNALAARRDAALLDRRGALREGRPLAQEAAKYAEAVLRRVLKLPSGLLAFSGAISRYLPKDRLPGEQEIARIPALYNLLEARTDPARLGEWIRSWLLKQIEDRPTGLDWSQLIRPEDWRSFAFGNLIEILVSGATSEEGRALVQLAEAEARRPERQETVSEEWLQKRWNELPAQDRPGFLARLLGSTEIGRSLVESGAAVRLSASLSVPELAAAAGQSPPLARLFTQATSDGALSDAWALRLLEDNREAAVPLAAAVLPAAIGSPRWQQTLQSLFERLLAIPSPPATLLPALEKALGQTSPDSDLDTFLVLAELLVRAGFPKKNALIDRLWQAAAELSDRREQGRLLDRIEDAGWKSFQRDRLNGPDGKLSPPWMKSYASRLLKSDTIREHLSTGLILEHADPQAPLGPWLDPRVKSDFHLGITDLLRADQWSRWRQGSDLRSEDLRSAARAWLTCKVWQERPAPQARLEDWKRVMADLERISGEELQTLFLGNGSRWPWITPFQDEQLADLCGLAQGDLGVLAELADGLDPKRDLGYPIQGTIHEHVLAQAKLSLGAGLPGNALAYLSASPPSRALLLRAAEVLLDNTEHRRDWAVRSLRNSIKASLETDPAAALQAAERLAPWQDHGDLLTAIQNWKRKQPSRVLEGRLGDILRRHLEVPSKPRTQSPTVLALLQGTSDNGCWKKLSEEVTGYLNAGLPAARHPVSRLSADLQEALPQLQQDEREVLEERGWRTFAKVARAYPPLLRHPLRPGEPLPALEVAALLLPKLGIGTIALRLAFLGTAYPLQEEWWESLLSGLAYCHREDGLMHPRDREEAALTLIHQSVPDLFCRHKEPPAVQQLIEERMKWLYYQRGLHLVTDLVPRAAHRAGAAR